MIERRTIEIMGLLGPRHVPALVRGDWAAHENVDVPGLYVLTILPLGFCLPPFWASFPTALKAVRAMKQIALLRNDWHRITQADLTLQLKAQIQSITARCGAIRGPHAIAQIADRSPLGLPMTSRPNGYRSPEIAA
jgi:hypothetical protein